MKFVLITALMIAGVLAQPNHHTEALVESANHMIHQAQDVLKRHSDADQQTVQKANTEIQAIQKIMEQLKSSSAGSDTKAIEKDLLTHEHNLRHILDQLHHHGQHGRQTTSSSSRPQPSATTLATNPDTE